MSQPLEAKLRRLRELNAKAEKLKVDVNRLWRRFPPLPGSYVGMGVGVPEGDPQLTRTVTTNTTAPHEACKRIFMTCVESVFTIEITEAACPTGGTDTSLEGLSYTFDSSIFSADKCDAAWDETLTGGRHGIKSEDQCGSGNNSLGIGDRFIIPYTDVTLPGSYACDAESLIGVALILTAFQDSGPGSPGFSYAVRVNQLFSGTFPPSGIWDFSEYNADGDGYLPGCSADELAIGESRELTTDYYHGSTGLKRLVLTRVS